MANTITPLVDTTGHASVQVQGIDVHVEGSGPHTIVMVHGWPDSYRLWDSTVAALKDQYRCVRFTLPGFDLDAKPRPTALADMAVLLSHIVAAVSPNQPVTLLMHDWGCVFGYEYAARYPAQVQRIVAVDIGDHNSVALQRSLSGKAKWDIFAYQFWLATAWKLGSLSPALGNRMTRWMAGTLRCRAAPATIGWQMNYPYAMQWLGLLGGFRCARPVQPACPLLYIYGKRKPFMFHSPQWLEQLAARPQCAVQALGTGHWVMVEQPGAFNDCLRAWLSLAR